MYPAYGFYFLYVVFMAMEYIYFLDKVVEEVSRIES